jgi:hypothetical protein
MRVTDDGVLSTVQILGSEVTSDLLQPTAEEPAPAVGGFESLSEGMVGVEGRLVRIGGAGASSVQTPAVDIVSAVGLKSLLEGSPPREEIGGDGALPAPRRRPAAPPPPPPPPPPRKPQLRNPPRGEPASLPLPFRAPPELLEAEVHALEAVAESKLRKAPAPPPPPPLPPKKPGILPPAAQQVSAPLAGAGGAPKAPPPPPPPPPLPPIRPGVASPVPPPLPGSSGRSPKAPTPPPPPAKKGKPQLEKGACEGVVSSVKVDTRGALAK